MRSGSPKRCSGDCPRATATRRYAPLPPEQQEWLAQASAEGWHYAARDVEGRGKASVRVTLVGREGGAHVAYIRGEIERLYDAWLPPTKIVSGEAFAGWVSEDLWMLIRQRGDVVLWISMSKYAEGRRLSRAIVGDRTRR